jgi:hypothetical protein
MPVVVLSKPKTKHHLTPEQKQKKKRKKSIARRFFPLSEAKTQSSTPKNPK